MQIPKAWYAIAHINEIKTKPIKLERFEKNLVLWKTGSNVIAMENRCPHRGAELSLGKTCGSTISCPFHGFKYDNNGNCIYSPETKGKIPNLKAKTYPTKIIADMVWINIFENTRSNSYAFDFVQNLHDRFNGKYSLITDVWQNNIRHCIENQLDYTHLATVHKNSIGKGYNIPNNIKLEVTNNYIKAIKDDRIMLHYTYPNHLLLNNTDKFNICVYFAPINEHQTKLYLINYRKFMTFSLIKPFVDAILKISNKIILNEDKRVVQTQKYDENYGTNDFLLKHDQIIKEFRKMWKE